MSWHDALLLAPVSLLALALVLSIATMLVIDIIDVAMRAWRRCVRRLVP